MKKDFIVPIYSRRIVFCDDPHELYYTIEKEKKKFSEEPLPSDEMAGLHGYVDVSGRSVFMGVFDGDLQTLEHEAGHAAFRILSLAGVPINPEEDEETFCYMLDWICSQWRKRMKWVVNVSGPEKKMYLPEKEDGY